MRLDGATDDSHAATATPLKRYSRGGPPGGIMPMRCQGSLAFMVTATECTWP